MSNIIEFPLDRRIEQMAEKDGFFEYDKVEIAELDSEQFLSDLLRNMYELDYEIDGEEYIYDVSFLFESLRSFVYKMNKFDHPIQVFAKNLYWDQVHPNTSQLEFDF